MNNIITQDPELVLQNSNAHHFMVIWSSSHGTFFGTGGGSFQNALHGPMDSPAVSRNDAVKEYYNLVNVAKSHDAIKDGRIELVPLPMFEV